MKCVLTAHFCMKVDFMLNHCFGSNIKWHCKDLNSRAMVEFNVASPFGQLFSVPVIEVKEMKVNKECLFLTNRVYKEDMVTIVCLVYSKKKQYRDKGMTVSDVIEKLKTFDSTLDVCCLPDNYSGEVVFPIINVCYEIEEEVCKKYNLPNDYKGTVTNFIV